MKYLVTGGAGFIGSNFIRYLFKKYPSSKVINLDKLTYGKKFNNLSEFNIDKQYDYLHEKRDICNPDVVEKVIKDNNIDTIVHFAASTHVDTSISKVQEGKYKLFKSNVDSGDFILNNIWGTQVLLQAAVKYKIKKFHHISTDEVFGDLPLNSTEKFTEKSPYNPSSPYSASKAGSDHLVRAYIRTFGLPATITNCSNNYGPYQHSEKFIPTVILNALQGKKIPLYGNGLNVRDWIYVDDHNAAVDLILQKGKIGETYLIGANNERSNLEIVKLILKLLGKDESLIEFVADRPGHDLRYAIDSSKIQNKLGWKPETNFEKGLAETVKWYKDNSDWWQKSN